MRVSIWCDSCQNELFSGVVDKESSIVLSSVPIYKNHMKKGHLVLLRDKNNVDVST